jgi:hypothetical protein
VKIKLLSKEEESIVITVVGKLWSIHLMFPVVLVVVKSIDEKFRVSCFFAE